MHNAIINLLLLDGSLTTKQLHERLMQHEETNVTLTQLYNILKQLYNSQIVSKYEKKYQINMLWINQLEDTVKNYYQKSNHIDRKSFDEGQRIVLKAGSLAELDPIWGDVFYTLGNLAGTADIHTYNSDLYHVIGMYATEKNFYSSTKYNFHFVVQRPCVLNDYGIDLYQKVGIRDIIYAKTDMLFGTPGRVINVVGDYIIDFLMPEQMEHYFNYHFTAIQEMTQFHQSQFTALFDLPIQCKLTVIHSKVLAAQYREVLMGEGR
jgi:hypothetical protein